MRNLPLNRLLSVFVVLALLVQMRRQGTVLCLDELYHLWYA